MNDSRKLAGILCTLSLVAACGGGGGGGSEGGGGAIVTGSVDLPGTEAGGIHVAGNYAYVGTGSAGLQVVDVSNKSAPAVVAAEPTIYAVGYNFAARHDMGTERLDVPGGTTGVSEVDITAPLSPATMTTVNTPGYAHGIAATDEAFPVFCVADSDTDVFFIYSAGGDDQHDVPGYSGTVSAAARDRHCFVTDQAGAMHVFDTSTTPPTLAHTLALTGAWGIVIKGNYAYVAAGDPGMYVIEITTPSSPTIVGQTGPLPVTGWIAVDPVRDLVYLTTIDTMGFPTEGLKIIDVSDPASPQVDATVDLPDLAVGVAVLGDYVYVVTQGGGGPLSSTLQIIDVSGF